MVGSGGSVIRNDARLATRTLSPVGSVARTLQRYDVLACRLVAARNVVSERPAVACSVRPPFVISTVYFQVPVAAAIRALFHTNNGRRISKMSPAGEFGVTSVSHAGTVRGPVIGDSAAAPDVPCTLARQ